MVTPPGEPGTLFGLEPVADTSAITGPSEGLVRADASDTSRAAARLVQIRTGTQRAKVLIFLVKFGPATDVELAEALNLSPNSERPRRIELTSGGFVTDTGETREHHGAAHTLWAATDAGRRAAGDLEAGA
jgi:hypothetical protein